MLEGSLERSVVGRMGWGWGVGDMHKGMVYAGSKGAGKHITAGEDFESPADSPP